MKTRRSALFLKGALVGVVYYAGALVGFALKFPSQSPSALWPPNSILLAALLLLPRRQWWIALLGAFAAHLLVQLPSGVPIVMSLAFFLSNSCEALLGAFLIRRWIDGPLRFDTLKSAGVFVLAAVVVAPFLSSFLDAGFVTLIGWQKQSYWHVWRARLPSNALAALAIPPAIVLWANDGPAWLRRISTRQRAEALIMIGGLLAVSVLVFASGDSRHPPTPALLFLPLPLLLWAAVRFGPPATSASLLVLIFVSIWGAAKGLGPFGALSPTQNVLSLQMFLLAISVPLIFLAAAIEERRKKEDSLRESEEHFRTVADTAPVLIWTTDADKLCTYVSQTWLDLTGRLFEEELGNGWGDEIHPGDRDARLEVFAHCFDQRSPYTLEYRVRRHDGEYRWLLDKGTPRFASDGTFLGYIGSATDITERKRVEDRLRVQHTVALILAEAATIEEATPRILRAMGECLGWDVGALWRVDRGAEVLRCVELWHEASIEVPKFERVSREFTFVRGLGLPGRVWSSLEPEYIHDVVPDDNFPRAPIAEQEGLHAAFGFPILLGGEVLGVIEFFSREIRQPDQELLNMLATIGSQIGQFIERKLGEEALRESEAKIRRLVDANIIGIFIWDLDGRIIEANDAFLRIVNYDHEDLASGRIRWTGLTPPEWLDPDVRRWVPELQMAGSLQPFEKEYFRKDGGRVPVLIGLATFEEGGNQGVAFVLDLTERKSAEQALRESEAKFREYAETASDWFWEIGPDYKFTLLTENAFGSHATDRIGTAFWDHALDLETEPEKWRLVWATLDSRKPFRDFVYCGLSSNGSPMHVKASGKPVFDASGEFRGYRGTGSDVTAIMRAQEALRESERKSRSAIDGIAGLVAILTPSGEVETVNRQCLEYFGRSLEDLANWKITDAVHPEDLPRVFELFTRAMASGIPFNFELRLRRFDGEYRWYDNRGVPIPDDSGRITRWYVLLTDIEDRTQALSRLEQMQSDFAHVNRVSMMGELAASLSHEITQPIASARNNARAAQNFLDMQPPDLGEVREALACIVGNADRAGDLIDRIREQIKKAPPRKERFDLNAAIDEVILLGQSAIIKNRVWVQTRLSEGLSPVYGDRVQLQQVVLNLLLNAVEAMSSDEAKPRDLLISTEQDHTGVLVAVHDSGPGIHPEHLDRVFKSFYTTKPGGTGMGLSICRSIIDAHGGKLWAKANEPRGVIFQFTLPASDCGGMSVSCQ
jgi:PAS domain S-box-containing protein